MRINLLRHRLAGDDFADLPLQFFDRLRAGAGDGLVAGGENAFHAERLVQRIQRHERDGRGAIRIGDDALVPLHVGGVDFGNRPAARRRPCGTRWNCPRPRSRPWRRWAQIPSKCSPPALNSAMSMPSKESFVSSLTVMSCAAKFELFADRARRREQRQFAHRKISLFQRFDHFDADGAGRADHGHMRISVHKSRRIIAEIRPRVNALPVGLCINFFAF